MQLPIRCLQPARLLSSFVGGKKFHLAPVALLIVVAIDSFCPSEFVSDVLPHKAGICGLIDMKQNVVGMV